MAQVTAGSIATQVHVEGSEPLSEKIEVITTVDDKVSTGQTTPAVAPASEKTAEATPATDGAAESTQALPPVEEREKSTATEAQPSDAVATEAALATAPAEPVPTPAAENAPVAAEKPRAEETKVEEPVAATAAKTSTSKAILTAEQEEGNIKSVPFAHPAPNCTPAARPKLNPEQQIKYDDLLVYCREIKTIPVSSAKGAEEKPLTEEEQMWMTEECLLRYLRAVKWVLAEAKKRVVGTLVWRREWGVERHTPEYIEIENRTGKQVIMGYDNEARPCLYLNPARQNTERSQKQIEHLVFMVERVLDLSPPGQETLALLTDFASTNSGKTPPLWQGKQTLNILQTHYPERLGRALVVNIPWFVWGFFKIITPFIDPLTREKLKFNEKLSQHVPVSQLLKEFGGEVEMTYDHEKYWPALITLAKQRRKEMSERWKANGSKIGESEFYLKGGKIDDGTVPPTDPPKETTAITAESSANQATVEGITEGVSKVKV